jgi:hypothetical protein
MSWNRDRTGAAAFRWGINATMSNPRRFALDELTLRPGTYFNPQTEIMVVVDDSPEVDHELFEVDDFDSSDWVLISDETPVDEPKRDDLVERFQLAHQTGADVLGDGDDPVDDDEDDDEDDEDELDELDELDLDLDVED